MIYLVKGRKPEFLNLTLTPSTSCTLSAVATLRSTAKLAAPALPPPEQNRRAAPTFCANSGSTCGASARLLHAIALTRPAD